MGWSCLSYWDPEVIKKHIHVQGLREMMVFILGTEDNVVSFYEKINKMFPNLCDLLKPLKRMSPVTFFDNLWEYIMGNLVFLVGKTDTVKIHRLYVQESRLPMICSIYNYSALMDTKSKNLFIKLFCLHYVQVSTKQRFPVLVFLEKIYDKSMSFGEFQAKVWSSRRLPKLLKNINNVPSPKEIHSYRTLKRVKVVNRFETYSDEVFIQELYEKLFEYESLRIKKNFTTEIVHESLSALTKNKIQVNLTSSPDPLMECMNYLVGLSDADREDFMTMLGGDDDDEMSNEKLLKVYEEHKKKEKIEPSKFSATEVQFFMYLSTLSDDKKAEYTLEVQKATHHFPSDKSRWSADQVIHHEKILNNIVSENFYRPIRESIMKLVMDNKPSPPRGIRVPLTSTLVNELLGYDALSMENMPPNILDGLYVDI